MPRRFSRGLHRRCSETCPDADRGGTLQRLRTRLADERGVTLMELLVTMAVMIIVLAALSQVAVSASTAEVQTNRRFQAQTEGRKALDKLRRELHCASSLTVVNSSGTALAAGTSGTGIYVSLGGYCPTNGLTSSASTTVRVTWCTSASTLVTGDFALYRLASTSSQPTCATTGVKWADYLTTSTPFCLPNTITACGGVYKSASSLPTLRVTLPVNLNGPSSTKALFKLIDDIALRNSARS